MARPSKLTATCQQEVITALQAGASYEIASAYAGISYHSFNNWMKRGKAEAERIDLALDTYNAAVEEIEKQVPKLPKKATKEQRQERKATLDAMLAQIAIPQPDPDEKPFLEFFKAVTEANAVAAVAWLQIIDTAATKDPHWAAWMLAKRYPEIYGAGGRSTTVSVKSNNGSSADPTSAAPVEIMVRVDDFSDMFRQMAEYERATFRDSRRTAPGSDDGSGSGSGN